MLRQTDWVELCEQAEQQGECLCTPTHFGVQFNLPGKLGEGGDRILHLKSGLTIHIRNARLPQPLIIEQQHDAAFPVTAKFYLSGSSHIQTPGEVGIAADYEELAGYSYFYYLPNLTEVEEWPADVPIHVVMIYSQIDYFHTRVDASSFPTSLQGLFKDSPQCFHHSLGAMSPAMLQTLQQLLRCPYQGMTQHLYVESKALELLALQFDQLTTHPEVRGPIVLGADDLDRLYDARDRLVQQSMNPPSLIELARQVGLNDRKLKQGFRQLFNTTVFGYLQDYRMQQAQQLLRQTNLTVAQIATQVGYRNPEAFSTAFRRKFAVSPKAYQLEQRG